MIFVLLLSFLLCVGICCIGIDMLLVICVVVIFYGLCMLSMIGVGCVVLLSYFVSIVGVRICMEFLLFRI